MQNLKRNCKSFYDHVRGVTLYQDVLYKATVTDSVERGCKRQRKLAVATEHAEDGERVRHDEGLADDEEEAPPLKGQKTSKRAQAKEDPPEPKLKKGQVTKITKVKEQLNAKRLECLDMVQKAEDKFAQLIPAYIIAGTKEAISTAGAESDKISAAIEKGCGHFDKVMEAADACIQSISSTASRMKVQLEHASSWKP